MTQRSLTAAERRAAPAALLRPEDLDRYLLIDDSDEYSSEITSLLRERNPRGLEVLS